jgi:uncharacterized protein YndB with AHSA1/START domain
MTDEDNGDTTASVTSETRELTTSRVVEAPPERVYEAFTDPDELGQWMHPSGATCEVHHLEAEEGGTYRITMSGETPDGNEYGHTYGGTFEELVPGERIVQTEAPESDGSGMDGEMTVTITFDDVPDGTEVTVLLEIPATWPDGAIGGWEAALGNLAARLGGE